MKNVYAQTSSIGNFGIYFFFFFAFVPRRRRQYLANVHAQQLGNQNVSVYKLLPSPLTAIKRFWTYFCSQRDEYPFGSEHRPEQTLDLRISKK